MGSIFSTSITTYGSQFIRPDLRIIRYWCAYNCNTWKMLRFPPIRESACELPVFRTHIFGLNALIYYTLSHDRPWHDSETMIVNALLSSTPHIPWLPQPLGNGVP